MFRTLFSSVLLLILVAGCNSSTSQKPVQTPADAPASDQVSVEHKPAPPPPPPVTSPTTEQKPAQATSAKSGPQSPTAKPGMLIEKAAVGSGEKGRGYEPGIITTPVSTYFQVRERIFFEIQLPEFIRAYKFEHDFKGPKTNEEFWDKIIKKNNLESRMPDLPPGHRYVYDPKTEQLMVERPQ